MRVLRSLCLVGILIVVIGLSSLLTACAAATSGETADQSQQQAQCDTHTDVEWNPKAVDGGYEQLSNAEPSCDIRIRNINGLYASSNEYDVRVVKQSQFQITVGMFNLIASNCGVPALRASWAILNNQTLTININKPPAKKGTCRLEMTLSS